VAGSASPPQATACSSAGNAGAGRGGRVGIE